MKPIAPLMIEHRLAKQMLALLGREHARISKTGAVDRPFLDAAVDFFKNFLDRFHHGKEEDILFRDLEKKPLTTELRIILNELIDEHKRSRKAVASLAEAVNSSQYDTETIREITGCLKQLLDWYPAHIEKEDKQFFIPAMNYLTRQEQDAMLEAMREFDRAFTRNRYAQLVKDLEAEQQGPERAGSGIEIMPNAASLFPCHPATLSPEPAIMFFIQAVFRIRLCRFRTALTES